MLLAAEKGQAGGDQSTKHSEDSTGDELSLVLTYERAYSARTAGLWLSRCDSYGLRRVLKHPH